MQVCLFDIDGTLIHSAGAGLRALRIAMRAVFDVDADFGSPEETALEGIRQLKAFYKGLGLPVSLTEADIPGDRFEEMAAKCTEKGPVGNFKKLYKEDVVNIFTLAQ